MSSYESGVRVDLLSKQRRRPFMTVSPLLIVSLWTLYNSAHYWLSHLVEVKSPGSAGKHELYFLQGASAEFALQGILGQIYS